MSKFEESFQKAMRATSRKATKKVIVQKGQYLNEPPEYRVIHESKVGAQASEWMTKTKAEKLAGRVRGDRDKPTDVLSVYDTGPESTSDRYTVVLSPQRGWQKELRGAYQCIALSSNPNSPQGFSQFSSCMLGKHLGRRVEWSTLPQNIRDHIKGRLA